MRIKLFADFLEQEKTSCHTKIFNRCKTNRSFVPYLPSQKKNHDLNILWLRGLYIRSDGYIQIIIYKFFNFFMVIDVQTRKWYVGTSLTFRKDSNDRIRRKIFCDRINVQLLWVNKTKMLKYQLYKTLSFK